MMIRGLVDQYRDRTSDGVALVLVTIVMSVLCPLIAWVLGTFIKVLAMNWGKW